MKLIREPTCDDAGRNGYAARTLPVRRWCISRGSRRWASRCKTAVDCTPTTCGARCEPAAGHGATGVRLAECSAPAPRCMAHRSTCRWTSSTPRQLTNPMAASKLQLKRSWLMCRSDASVARGGAALLPTRWRRYASGLIGEDRAGHPQQPHAVCGQSGGRRLPAPGCDSANDYAAPDGTGVRDHIHVMDPAEGHPGGAEAPATTTGWTRRLQPRHGPRGYGDAGDGAGVRGRQRGAGTSYDGINPRAGDGTSCLRQPARPPADGLEGHAGLQEMVTAPGAGSAGADGRARGQDGCYGASR